MRATKKQDAGHLFGTPTSAQDVEVPINGMANRRGMNVVVIDTSAGHILSAKTYDIWGNPQVGTNVMQIF